MPPRNERVATMVRNELTKDVNVSNDVLVEKARAMDATLRKLSPRQFHATYRLPALRAVKQATPGGAPAKSAAKSTGNSAAKTATPEPTAPSPAAPATPSAAAPAKRRGRPPRSAQSPAETAPSQSSSASATPAQPSAPAQSPTRSPAAVLRANAAEREAVRQILHSVAREALGTEDRGSFVKLLDSLDERAAVIVGMFVRR
jgi:hypothetical protein